MSTKTNRSEVVSIILCSALAIGVMFAIFAFADWFVFHRNPGVYEMTPAQTRAKIEATRSDFELWLTGELATKLGEGEQWPGREHVFRRDPQHSKSYAITQVESAWQGWGAALRHEWRRK